VTQDLNLKISDFGNSIWRTKDGQQTRKPTYVGGKDIYSKIEDKQSDLFTNTSLYDIRWSFFSRKQLLFSFEYVDDFSYYLISRLFGIVLVKLTQCGKDVDVDMYDKIYNWRTSSFSLDFESSPSYKKLIEWCFTAPITSPIVTGITQSICVHNQVLSMIELMQRRHSKDLRLKIWHS
jgi:hypothetical protein